MPVGTGEFGGVLFVRVSETLKKPKRFWGEPRHTYIDAEDWETLSEYDQLNTERAASRAFDGFSEGAPRSCARSPQSVEACNFVPESAELILEYSFFRQNNSTHFRTH